jgi:hypothetical protein
MQQLSDRHKSAPKGVAKKQQEVSKEPKKIFKNPLAAKKTGATNNRYNFEELP